MNNDMEVRRAALRMEYQKRMVHSNFIGIILIFCFFYIKVKEERLILNSDFIDSILFIKTKCYFDSKKNKCRETL
jgi:hypothetical protein